MVNEQRDLFLIVAYAITFLFVFLIVIIVFIFKSRNDRIKIEEKKKEIEEIAKQKTILLKEIHHRVKNNLQLISGLLYLQSVKHKNKDVKEMIDESQSHINSIALVHEMLYKDDTLSLVAMDKYLHNLGSQLLQVSTHNQIVYQLSVVDVYLPVDYATTLGLIVNELITNSLKYAFSNDSGEISIGLKEMEKDTYKFTYSDNGKGINENSLSVKNKTLGQKLIRMLAEEIKAELTIKNNKGLSYIFNFKVV